MGEEDEEDEKQRISRSSVIPPPQCRSSVIDFNSAFLFNGAFEGLWTGGV
jgi:hypothetical protein